MVQPLIDFIVSYQGQPFLIILTAICHLFSSHYFDTHTFFMLVWTVIGSRLYMSYIGVDLVEKILNGFDTIIQRLSVMASAHLTKAVQDVS
jgi:hypothetical protein